MNQQGVFLSSSSDLTCSVIDSLVSDILPFLVTVDRVLTLSDCLYYGMAIGEGAPFTQIHTDTPWLQFPDADGFQIWFLLENSEETGNMFLIDTPLIERNDLPQKFHFMSDGSVSRELSTGGDERLPINVFDNVDKCKFKFKYLNMKPGECLLFSKRQLHMSDPRPALEKRYTNRLAFTMRVIIKKQGSRSIKFWPNHRYKHDFPLHRYLSSICDKNWNLSVGRYMMLDLNKFNEDN